MDQRGREALSAFVDDELSPEEARVLVDQLVESADAQKLAAGYRNIGEVMRAAPYFSANLSVSVADRVAIAIASEPDSELGQVVPFPDAKPRSWSRFAFGRKPASIAASLVLAGVLGFVLARQTEAPLEVATRTLAQPLAPTPVLLNVPQKQQRSWDSHDPSVQQRLRGYLVNHSEHVGRGMRGMHPYARVVSYSGNVQ